jgi:signal transduction histidine kinase
MGAFALLSEYAVHVPDNGVIDGLTTLLPFPIAYFVGLWLPRWASLITIMWMAVTVELVSGYVNPFVLAIVVAPWLVAVMVRERRRLAEQLSMRGQEIEAESELLAQESVRYERARVARELHDIVAHCVSVMVVQAYAGERLATSDQASAAEAFGHIADAAGQAQQEIQHLVELLGGDAPAESQIGLAAGLGRLVAGAAATGLPVELHIKGDADRLCQPSCVAAYRVVQESITNALKHAPGSPVAIDVDCSPPAVALVAVSNRMSPVMAGAGLRDSGGRQGLAGMRDRVEAAGGKLHAGPDPDGMWRVQARLPIKSTVFS